MENPKNAAVKLPKGSTFLGLRHDASAEEIVSTLEQYAEEERTVDRKALPMIRRREGDYTDEHYTRMLLAACKGHKTQENHGSILNALEFGRIFTYLYPRSLGN